MFTTSGGIETASPRPAKRPRIKGACGNCRDRKTRCDGHKPVCQACQCRGVEGTCRYDGPVRKRKATDGDRAWQKSLNAILGSEQQTSPRSSHPLTYGASPHAAAASGPAPLPTDSAPEPATPQGSYIAQSDGTGTLAEGAGGTVYGPSSIITFLRHVAAPPDGRETAGRAERMLPASKAARAASVDASSRIDQGSLQPRRRDADDFLRCYWELIHPLFPVLHRPDFTRRYESLWLSNGTEPSTQHDPYFARALDLVFAIGCKLSNATPQTQRGRFADHFYRRSRDVLLHDSLDVTSLPMVQIFLLEVVYLQSTQHSTRCVNMLCLAIRSAQTLGLHLPSDGAEVSRTDAEMQLRIWHTCLTLDR